MKVLGVDVGSYSIKVAELDANVRGFTIQNFFEFPLSLDPNQDRGLQIIEALRGLATKYEATGTRWVIGVRQHRVSAGFHRFPFRERAKIIKSLAFELEDDVPFDIDETVFDFKLTEFVGAQADVITVATPHEAVREVLDLAKDCSFDPDLISVEGLALANLYESWASPPRETSPDFKSPEAILEEGASTRVAQARIVLHLGHTHTLMLVYREGALIATRSILWGGSEIAHSFAKVFNVPFFEAIKILASKSFVLLNAAGATRDQIALSDAVTSQLEHLVREVKLTMIEVKTAFNLEFTQVDLLGGVAQIQNLSAYLTQYLEVPANINLDVVREKPSRVQLTPAMEAVAAVALGLAIEGVKRPRNPALNLRKGEFVRENIALKRFWERWRVPTQVVASAFAVFFVYAVTRDQIASSLDTGADDKITDVAQKVAGLKGAAATQAGIDKYVKTQRDRISHQDALNQLDQYVNAIDVVAKLSEKMPGHAGNAQGFDVTLLDIDNEDVTIKGRVRQASDLPLIRKTLEELALPKSLTTIASNDVTGGTPFGFKWKVKRKN